MNQTLMLLASLSAGIAAGCAFLLIHRLFQQFHLEHREIKKNLPLLFRLSLPLTGMLRKFASQEIFASFRQRDDAKLQMAGYADVLTSADMLSLRILFVIYAIAFLFIGAGGGQMAFCTLIAALLCVFPGLWLAGTIRRRHTSMMKALPNVLDLLTLSVESGRDLLSSLRDILERRKMDELGEELTRTFQEIQLGRNRVEALRALAKRVRQPDLSATVNAIVQAEEYGVSIGQLLRIQSDMQRNKRFALAEKLANESSVKIIIPVVICILPAVFIILMGPLLTQAFRFLR